MNNPPTAKDNLGIAGNVAKKYIQGKVPVMDSIEFSDACVGLVKAEESFDPSLGYEFSSYAYRLAINEVIRGWKQRKKVLLNESSMGDYEIEAEENQFLSIDDKKVLLKKILSKSEGIKKRDMDILKEYYFNNKTLQQVGELYKMTRERVRQIILNTVQIIRERNLDLIETYTNVIG